MGAMSKVGLTFTGEGRGERALRAQTESIFLNPAVTGALGAALNAARKKKRSSDAASTPTPTASTGTGAGMTAGTLLNQQIGGRRRAATDVVRPLGGGFLGY